MQLEGKVQNHEIARASSSSFKEKNWGGGGGEKISFFVKK
jgi:hypothetical protein